MHQIWPEMGLSSGWREEWIVPDTSHFWCYDMNPKWKSRIFNWMSCWSGHLPTNGGCGFPNCSEGINPTVVQSFAKLQKCDNALMPLMPLMAWHFSPGKKIKMYCNSAVHGPIWPNCMFVKSTKPNKYPCKVDVKVMVQHTGTFCEFKEEKKNLKKPKKYLWGG